MALFIPLVLLGLAVLLMTGSHIVGVRRERRRAAAEHRKQVELPVLIHSINDDRCTGCDACVVVCPTSVLDLVGNKSRVLHFEECIQCQQCMWSCPTQALVMHWENEDPPPLKVPNLDPYYQTAVKGMYLIGEVAGKPLVKNAANIGRAVIEHMRREGLRPGGGAAGRRRAEGSDSHSVTAVDVVIVGSGPGGLSAALTCIHHGLSYVVLEKEQVVSSTIARYPKGKDIMAEPYDVRNVSFLPVFDSRKEELLPVWHELIERTGIKVRLGEAVESLQRLDAGAFSVRTTVAMYRAQRVVLATGTRGKPRTLGVPGENLPKVASLLDDPSLYAGRETLVVGGGDSAIEAALALADAGAKVTLSYRGPALTRAQAKNRERAHEYIKRGRLKAHLGSNVVRFGTNDVVLKMSTGQEVSLANEATFVLIGADAPVAWLEKLGVTYVERPHWYALGATDQLVESLLGKVADTSRTAAEAAARVQGRAAATPRPETLPPPPEASVARPLPQKPTERPKLLPGELAAAVQEGSGLFTSARRFDEPDRRRPIPLAEFARESRKSRDPSRRRRPRDAEATRLLRSLRDEGARMAHEETMVSAVSVRGADASGVSLVSGVSEVSGLSIVSDAIIEEQSVVVAPDLSEPGRRAGRTIGHDDPTRFNFRLDGKPQTAPVTTPARSGPTKAIIVGLPARGPTPPQGTTTRRKEWLPAPTQITTPEMLNRLRSQSVSGAAPDDATVQVQIDPNDEALDWDDDELTVNGAPRRWR